MFAYCGNNPVSLSDPYGYCACSIAPPKSGTTYAALCPNCGSWGGGSGGGAGGEGVLIALLEAGSGILSAASKLAAWTFKAVSFSGAAYGTNIQDFNIPQVADQNRPDGQYQYWEAYLKGSEVIVGRGLSLWEASFMVACGQNVMCANQAAALWIVKINRYHNAVGPEVGRGNGFFWHYHPHRNTKVHIWFYGGVDS